ncbi:pyruvate dehydrogenase complex dihydrolipoamide acetyltransferase [Methylorubrum rhodesianum]|jgi:pyruvate dehydrogenase E2 component (dihydrolipoamide acetyltransferase)|uniref:Acetyltransferase component of pyruvate dehydrogenase complex n=1 Tax=Methylorubrum rhodesianum TaxID=29427 RepID=A0ABU9ZEL7_9HYPH|nr:MULTISPECIES: pyruvate dehydrogenase complex dihydrolipoamide acetyltransferase [Methylorubrum]MBB5761135.1 pyruvate dehydrogenase E2 component (dihydrolipoamide acetyltransferase) [Methylorubrum rhodesianum]MBI1687954.1 pyruvate dehydrogenase complex dihydrolipoamide acetyltransferase [Methylorubrum sp. DB1722]MBK3404534.1 pyruvate dehydrogenase complex dihydrolipoamide acetyltransferase [Methylorubrum rhodesianum]MBY0140508.1 pyruvate dehydrogenase complex dihydrolipoamide acetyltransferas
MPINVLMPALSPTMEKGNLAKWLKKEGDAVKSGDVIAEIETDKATMEVEAVDEGVLAKILVAEGTADVPVNELIALIAEEGEDPGSVQAPKGGAEAKTAPVEPKSTPDQNAAPDGAHASYARVDQAPEGAMPNGAASSANQPAAQASDGRIFASPLARRIAKQEGVDLSAVKGSGPHGRVIQRDVQAAIEGGTAKAGASAKSQAKSEDKAAAPAAAPEKAAPKAAPAGGAPAGLSLEQVKGFYEQGSFEEVPLDGMRKTIAKRLTEAMQVAPHFYLTVDCELDALMKLRETLNASAGKDKDGKPLFKLSVNDFVIKAMGLALTRVPTANAVWAEDRILRFKHAEVGVAVAIDGGLFTPVIRRADQKTLSAISNEMKDFAARARAKKLKPEEYQGGVTSVSNLGMFGIKHFTAVINPPQSTILAVGAGEQRVVVKDGAPAVIQAMTATLSCDHRVLDGALGAELIAAFKGLIENPMGMLV